MDHYQEFIIQDELLPLSLAVTLNQSSIHILNFTKYWQIILHTTVSLFGRKHTEEQLVVSWEEEELSMSELSSSICCVSCWYWLLNSPSSSLCGLVRDRELG